MKDGRINSIQSMGTLDGPGVRFVVFTQGCNLRCGCCHNPDTWNMADGKTCSSTELVEKALRYREYFASEGGVTVSGGEPLLQPEFVSDFFKLCHENGLNTCLDTSGSLLNDTIKELLNHTDRVLLDIKYTTNEQYSKYVGCSLDAPLSFLKYLNERKIPVTLRQVIIPTLNDNEGNIIRLKRIASEHRCVDNIELLPFKKICQVKYDSLGIEFPFASLPQPTPESINHLNTLLKDKSLEI
ncbi:MAG: pyruvate formate lyase-activating protein [Clostridia bacterium]|nr:pyruvate formate lyase-activating protein [Clostridia bacterium]